MKQGPAFLLVSGLVASLLCNAVLMDRLHSRSNATTREAHETKIALDATRKELDELRLRAEESRAKAMRHYDSITRLDSELQMRSATETQLDSVMTGLEMELRRELRARDMGTGR